MKRTRLDIYLTDGSRDYLDLNSSINDLKKKLSDTFEIRNLGFSINNQIGGYLGIDGSYVIENSLKITLIGFYSKRQINDFVRFFKELYNQESVLVCKQELDSNYYWGIYD